MGQEVGFGELRKLSVSPLPMQNTLIGLVTLGLAAACVPPDCDREDCGTCGVACCKLLLSFPQTSTVDLMNMLNSSLAKGGPDYRFVLQPTAEDQYGFGDLRPYHPEAVNFIGVPASPMPTSILRQSPYPGFLSSEPSQR